VNWADTSLALLSGLLALGTAVLLVRDRARRRGAFTVVLLVSFIVFQGLGRAFVFPRLNAWTNVREAESLPELAPLEAADPALYAATLRYVRGALDRAVDARAVGELVRRHLAPIAQRRLPQTSNRAAMAYVGVLRAALRALPASAAGDCYRILDRAAAPAGGSAAIPAPLRGRDFAAVTGVLAAAARAPQAVPTRSAAGVVLASVDARLRRRFGADAAFLRLPHLPAIDRARACAVDARLLDELLALPPAQGGTAVRFLWSRLRRD